MERLRQAGLRPSRPRLLIGELLFAQGNRHVSAEMIHDEARLAGQPVALATVYNTLNVLAEHGHLRPIEGAGGRTLFDTNTRPHHHYHVEGEDLILDVPGGSLEIARLPPAPPGTRILGIEVIVRLARTG